MTSDQAKSKGQGTAAPFKKLLVVCSPGSENGALANACAVADAWGAEVTAFAVLEPPVEIDTIFGATHMAADSLQGAVLPTGHMQSGTAVKELVDSMVAEAEEGLWADWKRAASDRAPSIAVKVGRPFVEIIRHVIAGDFDMVIKTADELQGLRGYVFSSTDQHLLRKAPCPVWLWKPGGTPPVRSVLVAVDVDEIAASEPVTLAGLNRRIAETAARIAAADGDGGSVTVLHVWDARDEGLVRRWSGSAEIAQDYVRTVEANHRRDLDRFVEDARRWAEADLGRKVKFVPVLERGVPRSTIADQIEARKADLLVMGTIARTGVPGFFIGNTAEDILNRIDCSVVTVKPPGFVSPIEG